MDQTRRSRRKLIIAAAFSAIVVAAFGAPAALAQTIIDEWAAVKAPPPPELKPVTIDPKTSALLMLDFVKQGCNLDRRPRCIASIPRVQKFLTEARAKGVPVVYSLSAGATTADIARELAPGDGEPMVQSGVDKFTGTDLEKILKDKGVKTVIVVGTASHGAVLYTASGAALRGMVIVVVDGVSADMAYAEQYTAWHLVNAPRISERVTLTKLDLIRY